MKKEFFYLDNYIKEIEGNSFIVIYVLELFSKTVFKIYKKHNTDLLNKLKNTKTFEHITEHIDYVIKSDKISLDIKL